MAADTLLVKGIGPMGDPVAVRDFIFSNWPANKALFVVAFPTRVYLVRIMGFYWLEVTVMMTVPAYSAVILYVL